MSLLYRVIYATHANGTHHKLALDALERLTRADADAWQRLFLKHVELYLDGSKAPDNEFKDFKNHVLHVRDKYWGGAPEKVRSWYAHLVTAMMDHDWPRAVYCAGVLSHYYTDPIHPFHTAQSEAENNIHRAVEWSINRSYDLIKREAEAQHPGLLVHAPAGPDWLKTFVCEGADKANAQYEKLIAHYDFNIGVVTPEAGLDEIAREVVGDLILYAADGFARILERAIAEAGATPPDVSLSLETILATLKIPRKWLQKRLSNAEDRRIVEAMYDELMATGHVEANLPEDDRVVRDLHSREVLALRAEKQATRRDLRSAGPLPTTKPLIAATPPPAIAAGLDTTPAVIADLAPSTPLPRVAAETAPAATMPTLADNSEPATQPSHHRAESISTVPAPQPVEVLPIDDREPIETQSTLRTYLSLDDDIEAAPSIGQKTADRLHDVDIHTVADLLDADPFDLADELDARHITADAIADWQDQAVLMLSIPGLRGGHAQLLVGAGYRSAATIADADPVELSADVLNFVSTDEGKRVLRDSDPPDLEKIKVWVDSALAALAA